MNLTFAWDFDGILFGDGTEFPNIGEPNKKFHKLFKRAMKLGVYNALWTCRVENELKSALEACDKYGLVFDCIHGQTKQGHEFMKQRKYVDIPRKITADWYIDDKTPGFDYHNMALALQNILNEFEQGIKS